MDVRCFASTLLSHITSSLLLCFTTLICLLTSFKYFFLLVSPSVLLFLIPCFSFNPITFPACEINLLLSVSYEPLRFVGSIYIFAASYICRFIGSIYIFAAGCICRFIRSIYIFAAGCMCRFIRSIYICAAGNIWRFIFVSIWVGVYSIAVSFLMGVAEVWK